jgi:hypothetical protein
MKFFSLLLALIAVLSGILPGGCKPGTPPTGTLPPSDTPFPVTPPAETMPPPLQTPTPGGYPAAALAAQNALAQQLGIDPGVIVILDVLEVEWPDACLGIYREGIMCAQVITPGYVVKLGYDGATAIYHTDKTGRMLVRVQ